MKRISRFTTLVLILLLSWAGLVLAQNSTGGVFQTGFNYVIGGQWMWRGQASPFIFEGTTDDQYETTLTVTNPTADRGWTLPDAAGSTFVGTTATQTLTNKTLTAPVLSGSVTGTYTLAAPTISGPTISDPIINTQPVAGGSSLTLTAAAHGGKVIALDTAAGTTLTLPAATGSGTSFCFVVTVAATSNQHRIVVVGNDAFFGGIFQGNDSDNTTVMWPTAADADQINMSGTATGGVKGARYCVTDAVTDGWSVIGWSDASGTEATPFATGQVS